MFFPSQKVHFSAFIAIVLPFIIRQAIPTKRWAFFSHSTSSAFTVLRWTPDSRRWKRYTMELAWGLFKWLNVQFWPNFFQLQIKDISQKKILNFHFKKKKKFWKFEIFCQTSPMNHPVKNYCPRKNTGREKTFQIIKLLFSRWYHCSISLFARPSKYGKGSKNIISINGWSTCS